MGRDVESVIAGVLDRLGVRSLALDVGSKTIGLARSDETGRIASAWETLSRRGQADDAAEVRRRVDATGASVVVVGLPLELDGREGHRARRVRRFVAALEPALEGVARVELWDERFSTAAAERSMIEGDLSRAKRKARIDAVAAQLILQGWLDAQPGAREERA